MLSCQTLSARLASGAYDGRLSKCYPRTLDASKDRLQRVLEGFQRTFSADGAAPVALFSSPGRTEIGGNHTDHQHGRVLAASVDLDVLACAAPNGTSEIRVQSEGYPALTVDLNDLSPKQEEQNTSAALVRGVAAGIAARGFSLGGCDLYLSSCVPSGAGLSSSAAYEVLIGTVLNHFFCGGVLTPVELAQIGQRAECDYFGKPCGLMDQSACAVGGTVFIDFHTPNAPIVQKIDWDFGSSGHALCIVDTGSSHDDLTDEYAAVTREMGAIAAFFGQTVLREVDEGIFRTRIPTLRTQVGDRAVLRAMHFFADDHRAAQEAEALSAGDFHRFLQLVRASGLSSALRLQNVWPGGEPREQAVLLTLALAEDVLEGAGAVRVHGGGFAGTIQAFVPQEKLAVFTAAMEGLVGSGRCHTVAIRPEGGCVLIDQ